MAHRNPNPSNVSDAIRTNLHFLCTNSESPESVLNILVGRRLITEVDKDTVMSKAPNYSRFSALYDMVRRKVTIPTTYPSLVFALSESGNIQIVQKLEETLNVLEGRAPAQPTGPAPAPASTPQEPVSNAALLKARLSKVKLEDFLQPIIRDIYQSTQSEPFMNGLYEKRVINIDQKEECAGIKSNAGRNDFLYRILFMRNSVDKCIDALDNPDNDHILEKMVLKLSN